MGVCFLYGMRGGEAAPSGGLPFLHGGERPETAEENTVWVGTESASGTYTLSAKEPEAELEEGFVWLQTSGNGVSVSMKRPVNLSFYLKDAYIYQGGDWTRLTQVCAYTKGSWKDVFKSSLMLYEPGNVHNEVTNAYDSSLPFLDAEAGYGPDMQPKGAHFTAYKSGNTIMRVRNLLALDGYTQLIVNWHVISATSPDPNKTLKLVVVDKEKKNILAQLEYGPVGERKTDILDLSLHQKNQEYYIAVMSFAYDASTALDAYVYTLELRK